MELLIGMKKNEGDYEAAFFVDKKFTRSVTGKSASDIVRKLGDVFLSMPQEDGAEITVTISMFTKEEAARLTEREKIAREASEAEEQAALIEKRNEARAREQRARDAMGVADGR